MFGRIKLETWNLQRVYEKEAVILQETHLRGSENKYGGYIHLTSENQSRGFFKKTKDIYSESLNADNLQNTTSLSGRESF